MYVAIYTRKYTRMDIFPRGHLLPGGVSCRRLDSFQGDPILDTKPRSETRALGGIGIQGLSAKINIL
jgi:hypothetical protein